MLVNLAIVWMASLMAILFRPNTLSLEMDGSPPKAHCDRPRFDQAEQYASRISNRKDWPDQAALDQALQRPGCDWLSQADLRRRSEDCNFE